MAYTIRSCIFHKNTKCLRSKLYAHHSRFLSVVIFLVGIFSKCDLFQTWNYTNKLLRMFSINQGQSSWYVAYKFQPVYNIQPSENISRTANPGNMLQIWQFSEKKMSSPLSFSKLCFEISVFPMIVKADQDVNAMMVVCFKSL